jgi:hypothetical protein
MNLRQYRRSEVVQAARVAFIPTTAPEGAVVVLDADGSEMLIHAAGLCAFGEPAPNDVVLLHPGGFTEWVSAAAFDAEWEPVGGPVLT